MIRGMLKVSYLHTHMVVNGARTRSTGFLREDVLIVDIVYAGKEGAAPKEGMAEALEDTKHASANIIGGA